MANVKKKQDSVGIWGRGITRPINKQAMHGLSGYKESKKTKFEKNSLSYISAGLFVMLMLIHISNRRPKEV